MPHFALLAILGCGSPEDRTTFHDQGGGGDTGQEELDTFDSDDFRELACDGGLPVFAVCPCDVALDWSGVTGDIYDDAVDPTGFERVAWVHGTDESAAEVLDDVCAGRTITSSDMQSYVDADVLGATTTHLSQLGFLGTPADLPKPGQTYWLWLSTDTAPGVDVRVVALVDVVEGGSDSIEVVWP